MSCDVGEATESLENELFLVPYNIIICQNNGTYFAFHSIEGGKVTVSRDDNSEILRYNNAR